MTTCWRMPLAWTILLLKVLVKPVGSRGAVVTEPNRCGPPSVAEAADAHRPSRPVLVTAAAPPVNARRESLPGEWDSEGSGGSTGRCSWKLLVQHRR